MNKAKVKSDLSKLELALKIKGSGFVTSAKYSEVVDAIDTKLKYKTGESNSELTRFNLGSLQLFVYNETPTRIEISQEAFEMKLLQKLLSLHEAAMADGESEPPTNVYDTVLAMLDNKLKSHGRTPDFKNQHVQLTLLLEEGKYRLFYGTIYDAEPKVIPVEAYILYNKQTNDCSFYDMHSHEIYIDGKHIGSQSDTSALDDMFQKYKFESGHPAEGAAQAYHDALKEL